MSGLLAALLLAACAPKPQPANVFADAKKALLIRIGPDAEMRYVSTTIRHGETAVCGLAGKKSDSAAIDRRFAYADGKLTLEDDVSAFQFDRLVVQKCPGFALFKAPTPPAPTRALKQAPAKP